MREKCERMGGGSSYGRKFENNRSAKGWERERKEEMKNGKSDRSIVESIVK